MTSPYQRNRETASPNEANASNGAGAFGEAKPGQASVSENASADLLARRLAKAQDAIDAQRETICELRAALSTERVKNLAYEIRIRRYDAAAQLLSDAIAGQPASMTTERLSEACTRLFALADTSPVDTSPEEDTNG